MEDNNANESDKARSPDIAESLRLVEIFYAMLNSLNSYNEIEIRGVISNVVIPAERDNCFIGSYYRACNNVRSLLALKDVAHFQAIAMLARSLFELAVDMRLLSIVDNSVRKMSHFVLHDKLRASEILMNYEAGHPLSLPVDSSSRKTFVQANKQSIDAVSVTLWTPKERRRLYHWSGLSLAERVKKLDEQLREIYHCFYAPLSWNVHPGLTAIVDLQPKSFAYICAQGYELSTKVFIDILGVIIDEYRLTATDPQLKAKMDYARCLPVVENAEGEEQLRRHLGLY